MLCVCLACLVVLFVLFLCVVIFFIIICPKNVKNVLVFVDGSVMTVVIDIWPSVCDSVRFDLGRVGVILEDKVYTGNMAARFS